jgi:hypothetical protein
VGYPQVIFLVLIIVDSIIVCFKHGKEYKTKHNLGITTINLTIILILFTWGGFFRNEFGGPQIMVCILLGVSYLITLLFDGQETVTKHNILAWIISKSLLLIPLYKGGFFG